MNDRVKTAPRWRSISFLIATTPFVFLGSSCMVGPTYQRPSAPVPQTYKEAPPESFKEVQGWKQAKPNDTITRGKWWEIYDDLN